MVSSEAEQGCEGILPSFYHGWLKPMAGKLKEKVVKLAKTTKNVVKDDPRRIVHCLKLGLAITIVSLFYYFEPLYDSFGSSSIWAIITTVVIFEFSVGATLGRGLNRAMATLAAGALGFGVHFIASLSGKIGQPILIGVFVSIISTTATFFRFFPKLKARYDYGILIFILTFSMVTVSGYRDDEILELAWHRLINILMGGSVAVAICIFVRPVWAGADLHRLAVTNLENLGRFFEGFGLEYFGASQGGQSIGGANLHKYRIVLSSKQNEEALTYQARWEPPHGKFRYRHPWKQYQKIGSAARECAYRFEILTRYLNNDRIQIPIEIQEQCLELCTESGKALKATALAMRDMNPPTSAKLHIVRAKKTTEELKSLLTITHLNGGMEKIVSAATLIYLLSESVSCTETIVDSVHDLVSLARLKTAQPHSGVAPVVEQQDSGDQTEHVIPISQIQSAAE